MKKLLILAITAIFTVTAAIAQSSAGKIIGTVSAPDGVIPGATIVVTDSQTGKTRTVISKENGTFVIPQLEFGTYSVTITAEGYKTFTTSNVKIDAGREYPLDALLTVGQVSEEVTITAEGATTINTSNAELSSTISQEQIKELPLNGRNPLSLLNLTAGANPTTNSINGQRSSSTDIRRDGLNVQDNFIRTGAFVSDVPTVDDTAEFTITTQNAGVDQGGGSSLIQLVTPRGGNEYHGALFAFNRNSKFAANEFFNNANDVDRPFLNRNQFGGSLSGPLPVPNFGTGGPMFKRDKSFFFFNYEGFRLAQGVSAAATTLLPQARNGTFTYTDNTGTQRTVNVLSGQGLTSPITQNQGGILTVDPIIQSRILSRLPDAGNGVTTGTNFLQVVNFNRSDARERNAYVFRFDYEANDRNSVNFVYKRNNDQDARTDIASGFSTTPFVNQGGPVNFFVGAYRIIPTNNFTNEFRAGFQYAEPFFTESNIPQDFLIGVPLITNPEGTFRSQGRNTLYRNFQDNAVYSIGNHSIRFGGQAEFYKVESINFGGITPIYNILGANGNTNISGLDPNQFQGGISTTELNRANNLRFLLGGIIGGGQRTANLISPTSGFSFDESKIVLNYELYSGYISDQWRVRPNLTLNFGLRYEYYTPLNAPSALFLEPVINNNDLAGSLLDPNGRLDIVGTNSGTSGDFTKPDRDNFAPSFSFAYSPKFDTGFLSKLLGGRTVIRGGYKLNYVNDEYIKSTSTLVGGNPGFGAQTINALDPQGTPNVRASLTPRQGFNPLPSFSTLPTLTPPPISFAQNNANRNFGSQVFGVDPNLQVQQTQEYNIGFQREIGFKSVLEIRYVGGKSDSLIRTTTFNQLDIQNNGFLDGFRIARQNCALQGATLANAANVFDPAFICTDARFNPNIAGSRPNPVFDNLLAGGILSPTISSGIFNTVRAFLSQGRAGSLAQFYLTNQFNGTVPLVANPNIFVDEILTNSGKYRYNALQAEIRRRYSNGFAFQANYTFQKTLTNVPDDAQNRQNEVQDNNDPDKDYGRPDYDRTHTFNANMIYELPFGQGKKFLNQGGWVDKVFGGFQFTSIVNLSSGPPITITDPRSTATITFQSDRQRAFK